MIYPHLADDDEYLMEVVRARAQLRAKIVAANVTRRERFKAWFWKLAGLGALACICGVMWFEVLR
jgi:hypothetical protein